MAEPLVSVIVPAYNRANYVGETITSVLAQTYTNWELVVVDDGSEDNTRDVVEAFPDPRIRYIGQPRRGVAKLAETINVGLHATTGELVTMLGSDDRWPPYRIEKQVPVFEEPNVVLCFGRGRLIDAEGRTIGECPLPRSVRRVMNRPVGSILGSLLVANWLPQYTVLLRRSALEAIGGYLQPPPLLAEDYPTHLALAMRGEFRFVDLFLGDYRMHASQQTHEHQVEMTGRDVAWVMKFFRELDAPTRELSGLTEKQLERALRNTLNNCHFMQGRRLLLRGDRRAARREFVAAFLKGSMRTKGKAALGLWCAALGIDLERVARVLHRPPLV